jgi:hypothetical protein
MLVTILSLPLDRKNKSDSKNKNHPQLCFVSMYVCFIIDEGKGFFFVL